MTLEEQQLMYRILFEDSDEEPTSAIYEIYDTLQDVIQTKQPKKKITLQ